MLNDTGSFPESSKNSFLANVFNRESQMKTLKVRYVFDIDIDILFTFHESTITINRI